MTVIWICRHLSLIFKLCLYFDCYSITFGALLYYMLFVEILNNKLCIYVFPLLIIVKWPSKLNICIDRTYLHVRNELVVRSESMYDTLKRDHKKL